MSQITVWKSDLDGRMFEDRKKYLTHLRKLARQNISQKKIARARSERDAIMTRLGQVGSPDALRQFVIDHWSWFFHNGVGRRPWREDKGREMHKLIDVSFELRWSDMLSNSHSCPQNGVTNWGRDSAKPSGYPGFGGTLKLVVRGSPYKIRGKEKYYDGFGSDYFDHTIINTGGGGGGGPGGDAACEYQYEVKLFADDFPGLALARERAKVWNVLSDENREFA